MKKYKVKEIFGPTIQGEGSSLGKAVLFLRFAGCNRWSGREEDRTKSICYFCDTDFLGGDLLTADEVCHKLNEIKENVTTVVLSGGEPTLQINEDLLKKLKENGFNLHLETNGSRELGNMLHYFEHISMSPKQGINETKLEQASDIKILYPFINDLITYEAFKQFKVTNFYLQPLWDSNKQETLDYIYKNPKLKLSPQLHKYLELKWYQKHHGRIMDFQEIRKKK